MFAKNNSTTMHSLICDCHHDIKDYKQTTAGIRTCQALPQRSRRLTLAFFFFPLFCFVTVPVLHNTFMLFHFQRVKSSSLEGASPSPGSTERRAHAGVTPLFEAADLRSCRFSLFAFRFKAVGVRGGDAEDRVRWRPVKGAAQSQRDKKTFGIMCIKHLLFFFFPNIK